MWLVCFLSFILCQAYAYGSDCNSLTGKWYNQLGSELIILNTTNGVITGEYRTAVERYEGAAGERQSLIRGVSMTVESDSLLAFSAVFNNGYSTTSWIGECVICGGDEALVTSWLLKKFVTTSAERWQSTIIGQDTFTRYDKGQGPRAYNDVHVPQRGREWKPSSSNDVKFRELEATVDGKWYSPSGEELVLSRIDENIKGVYANSKSEVFGLTSAIASQSTLGFSMLTSNPREIKIWVGQFHDQDDRPQVLDTSYLKLSSSKSCDDPTRAVQFGSEYFTRDRRIGGRREEAAASTSFFQKIKRFFKSLF